MEQRLQKLLASAGIASRRSSEELIARGKVTVNGTVVTEPGAKADPDKDDIRVDGKPLPKDVERVYLLLNKPTGYVSTVKDPHAERTVMQLVRGIGARVYPVGRLDVDSAGLLILTNDGEFTKLLTHPSHEVPKTYRAVVRGKVLQRTIEQLSKGIELEDGITAPADVQFVDFDSDNNASILDITLREGRNRQVRRMCLSVHHPVLALTRIRIGPVQLRGLPPGRWRKLHPAEVKQLTEMAESPPKTVRPASRVSKKPSAAPEGIGSSPRGRKSPVRPAPKPVSKRPAIPEATALARETAREITRKLREPGSRPESESAGRNRRPGPRKPRGS